ncbi:transcription termination factor NusA [Anaerovibrio sp.]|uniref:transcription termination factor NusA n=1 Tax=Anaerovibrio sp. TaxID=1872532 RepID=UPI001B4132E7|nr:transcription termination factor NusA [Anaerovibrio sp.]MBP3231732.1 transcription termination/antitermination protein NusA [Anaerovibrio sp.]MBR2142179.1 transcription termination/antitermination protein NusA [Anaerovibrio sp.]
MEAIEVLGKEKGISSEILFDAIDKALSSAYKKNYNNEANCRVSLDRNTGEYHVYAIKEVVEEVTNPVTQISLGMAHKISEDYAVGDTLEEEVTPANFGRIAAQNAKQVVVQAIREAERGIIFNEYVNRANDIITGVVQRVENKNVYINLGKTEAILGPGEQISNEKYAVGDRIKALIVEVKNTTKGPQVMISRTHPGLLKRLFELEVPEIQNGDVEIKSVAREPGMRSKIAVYAEDENIDAVGSCVGPRGTRVQTIVDELRNEKIDIVKWSSDPVQFIANALSPARVVSVAINESEKLSRVVVPDYQLSLAIGKEGQNARLAAKLTSWKIDIKSESQAEEFGFDDAEETIDIAEFASEDFYSEE